MAAEANPRIDLSERNLWIRNPLNPTGEIHSLLDPTQNLSYNRWSVSIVYDKTARQAYCGNSNKGLTSNFQAHFSTGIDRCVALLGHGRIILEKVTRYRGYELIDAEAVEARFFLEDGRKLACFRSHVNCQRTINTITGSIGPLFKEAQRVQSMIDFIKDKIDESKVIESLIEENRPIDNPLVFDIWNPNPAANVFNCITFALEAANAGGVNFYPLLGDRIIPRADIRSIEKLAERAIDEGLPLEPEIVEYIEGVETPAIQRAKRLAGSLHCLAILLVEGPHTLKEYKALLAQHGLPEEEFNMEVLKEAKAVSRGNIGAYAVDALSTLIGLPASLVVVPAAVSVQLCYSRVAKKERAKEGLVQFFKEE